MKKLIEYLTIALSIGGTLCLVGAVGAIDGGYNGIPMNDNWGAMFCINRFRNNYVYISIILTRII